MRFCNNFLRLAHQFILYDDPCSGSWGEDAIGLKMPHLVSDDSESAAIVNNAGWVLNVLNDFELYSFSFRFLESWDIGSDFDSIYFILLITKSRF